MAKIQLTIATEYVRGWGAWEGVREIVQNALDADQDGYEMSVTHSGSTLRIMSRDARLQKDVWLMGTSGKSAGGYRGQFGEGLKLGVLCLVRAGHDVKIVNRDETWSPKLEESEVFGGRMVLTIHTRQRENDVGGFLVEIGGIDKETWEAMRPRFLALMPQDEKDVIDVSNAKVLTASAMRGKIFVKGIFVQHDPDLAAGYDFKHMDTDRDRKMVDSYDLKSEASRAWAEALSRSMVKVDKVLAMMTAGAPETAGIGTGWGGDHKQAASALAEAFLATYGEGALPVGNMADAREAEHYGKKGVVVPQGLVDALKQNPLLNVTAVRENFAKAAQKTYGWSELSDVEKDNYTAILSMVERAAADLGYKPVEPRLTVVDFGDEGLMGLHESVGETATIKIAKKLLVDFDEALRVLVHEVAHDKGGDGEKSHERAEGRLFAKIISNSRKALPAPAAPAPAPVVVAVEPTMSVEADEDAMHAEVMAIINNPNSSEADRARARAWLLG